MKQIIVILAILIGVASANGQKVKVEADRNVDLAKYKTYSWDRESSPQNPLVHQIIVEAVDQKLSTKGLTKVENGGELTITSWAVTQSDLHNPQESWNPGMNSINTGIVTSSRPIAITEGTLFVVLLDAKTKSSVWRGIATDTLQQGPTGHAANDAKSVDKKIRKAIEKMFKKYPRP
jgi:Domain of unknown function (DUF4136)